MMFYLLPSLILEFNKYHFLLKSTSPNLSKIFPPLTSQMRNIQSVSSSLPYDYQAPLGSICQYRQLLKTMAVLCLLQVDPAITTEFRDATSMVGLLLVLMAGGRQPQDYQSETLPLKLWKPILSNPKFKFVSLQYGDDYPHIKRFSKSSGLTIHHDDDIDPSKDMNRWLSQVDAMDYVISVLIQRSTALVV